MIFMSLYLCLLWGFFHLYIEIKVTLKLVLLQKISWIFLPFKSITVLIEVYELMNCQLLAFLGVLLPLG